MAFHMAFHVSCLRHNYGLCLLYHDLPTHAFQLYYYLHRLTVQDAAAAACAAATLDFNCK